MQKIGFIVSLPLIYVIALLPFRLTYVLSDGLSFFLFHIVRYRRKLVRKNLLIAGYGNDLQKCRAIEKGFYRHFCDMYFETFKSLTMSKKQIQSRFVVHNTDLLTSLAAKNKSILMMCGHYASYEWLLSLGYYSDHTAYGIYSPLSNPHFDKLIRKARRRFGAYLIPRKETVRTIEQHQSDNYLGLYGFASDQSPRVKSKTYFRDFLGATVPVFTGAERIAKEHDIPVLMAKVRKAKRGYYETELITLSLDPKKEKENAITDAFTVELEKQIRENPIYYLWSHNRFKFMKS